jgi:hypothetical protein
MTETSYSEIVQPLISFANHQGLFPLEPQKKEPNHQILRRATNPNNNAIKPNPQLIR